MPHTMKPVARIMKSDMARIGDFPFANVQKPSWPTSRPALHKLLLSYVQELGIPFELGTSFAAHRPVCRSP